MTFKVLKNFNTPSSRFSEGMEITQADLSDSPVPWDDLVTRGFVSKPDEPQTPATPIGDATLAAAKGA